MRRRNRFDVRAILRALSNCTVKREHGTTIITISIGGVIIIIKIPP